MIGSRGRAEALLDLGIGAYLRGGASSDDIVNEKANEDVIAAERVSLTEGVDVGVWKILCGDLVSLTVS
jgi:hypothetical protein